MASKIKADSAAIREYLAALQRYAGHDATHEGATETAFSNLLAVTARPHGWTLIPKKRKVISKKVNIYPDGTLQDVFKLARGYWEAKDTADDLDAEIQKKIDKKYPLTNTIFEDTRRAVLFQNAKECQRYDLQKPGEVADLLNRFYDYTEPDYLGFDEAIGEFKVRMPELGAGLAATIAEAHKKNKKFQAAFAEFFELCQTALNPDIRQETVDEMLVQHLLTERLFRTIFKDDEFTRRNVIAAEVEKVIDALVSGSFSKAEFMKRLDRFYIAIEQAAETIDDFKDKQDFLNTLYERFFQGYCVKTADTHGIVYTPQPIVDFMCASVEEVLKTEFGLTLGSKEVKILDPCTGTGNFVVNLLRRVPKKDLPAVYAHQLFANEVMLLPYYIAALNIERAYFDITGEYKAFEGLCFVDTLDMIHEKQPTFLSERNTERVQKQKTQPITVVIGNPPYNADQESDNDNNRNRSYTEIDSRIRKTYAALSTATNKNKLFEPYVRFIRWASDRLGDRDGIVAYITNNNFIESKQFDGLRLTLQAEFQMIYHIDLHGDVRANPTLSGTTHNVFGIQTGVGITLCIRKRKSEFGRILYSRIPEKATRTEKLELLASTVSIRRCNLTTITPSLQGDWIAIQHGGEFDAFLAMVSPSAKSGKGEPKNVIFKTYGPGLQTNRDEWVYGFDEPALLQRVGAMIDTYNAEIDRWNRAGRPKDVDSFVISDESQIKWSSRLKETFVRMLYANSAKEKVRVATYRPFTKKLIFYDAIVNHRQGLTPLFFPDVHSELENVAIVATCHSQIDFSVYISRHIPDVHIGARAGTCFPFYIYDADGSNRRENITDWSLKHFRKQYTDKKISKWDIFYYVYGVLHHPGYRSKFADNLKKSLPRIPFAPDFRAFANAGK